MVDFNYHVDLNTLGADLPIVESSAYRPRVSYSDFNGDKFPGGFGDTRIFSTDYWTLRARSNQIFKENLYAVGLINRLVTNAINTGIWPEQRPNPSILGIDKAFIRTFTSGMESRFSTWGAEPSVCDKDGMSSFVTIQHTAYREALISGDVLVVVYINPVHRFPQIKLICADDVRTPLDAKPAIGNEITHGVETNRDGKQVAYWVKSVDGKFTRIAAYGSKSGRRVAWLQYASPRRIGEVRGEPLLSTILQSLKEIDRYRDSTQRKAVINSILAMFIKKDADKISTLPFSNSAVTRGTVTPADTDINTRSYDVAGHIPGVVIQDLAPGETPVTFTNNTADEKFGEFEQAVIAAIAWSQGIPPEILKLAFSNNYSASLAAINEFKILIEQIWNFIGSSFCQPIYREFNISVALRGDMNCGDLLRDFKDFRNPLNFASWVQSDWYGSHKPSTDPVKTAKGSGLVIDRGWSTNARESRINTGTKFEDNIARLRDENEMLREAMAPLMEMKASGIDVGNAYKRANSGRDK